MCRLNLSVVPRRNRSRRSRIPSQAVAAGLVVLDMHYHGTINDPPRDPRHLRFVTPSETAGHIGPEGVYISSESAWYPDIPESLSTYYTSGRRADRVDRCDSREGR